MKQLFVILTAIILVATAGPAAASVDVAISGSAHVSVNSKYLWRGFDLSPGSDFVVQPGVDLCLGSFTVSYWSNWDENREKLIETDIILDYSFELSELMSVFVGNIYYELEGARDTNEFYLGMAFNTLLSPTFTVFWDWDEADKTGLFFTAGIGRSFDLADAVTLNLGALVSYNLKSDYAVGNFSAFHNGELSVGIDWEMTRGLVLSPALVYSFPLSDKADDLAGLDDEFMAGVTLAYRF